MMRPSWCCQTELMHLCGFKLNLSESFCSNFFSTDRSSVSQCSMLSFCPRTRSSEYFFPWLDSFCLWSRWPHRWATFDFLVSRWPHRWAVKGEWNKQLLQGINEGPGCRHLTGGGVHCNFLPRLLYFLHLTFDCMWCGVCLFLNSFIFTGGAQLDMVLGKRLEHAFSWTAFLHFLLYFLLKNFYDVHCMVTININTCQLYWAL